MSKNQGSLANPRGGSYYFEQLQVRGFVNVAASFG